MSDDKLQRRPKGTQTRGLDQSFSRRLKVAFKGAALEALKTEAIKKIYERLVSNGVRAEMARLTIARKLAAVGSEEESAERFQASRGLAVKERDGGQVGRSTFS